MAVWAAAPDCGFTELMLSLAMPALLNGGVLGEPSQLGQLSATAGNRVCPCLYVLLDFIPGSERHACPLAVWAALRSGLRGLYGCGIMM